MEIIEVRQKRIELQEAIEALISNFIKETQVEVFEINLRPAVYDPNSPYDEITKAEVAVELII
jgi:PIN domain nuclease of toxin-antitoxin system